MGHFIKQVNNIERIKLSVDAFSYILFDIWIKDKLQFWILNFFWHDHFSSIFIKENRAIIFLDWYILVQSSFNSPGVLLLFICWNFVENWRLSRKGWFLVQFCYNYIIYAFVSRFLDSSKWIFYLIIINHSKYR